MTEQTPAKKKCLGADCENDAGSLQCPKCLSLGIKGSFFCSQDCFKKNWVRRIFFGYMDFLDWAPYLAWTRTCMRTLIADPFVAQ